jgi:hypothetical protein
MPRGCSDNWVVKPLYDLLRLPCLCFCVYTFSVCLFFFVCMFSVLCLVFLLLYVLLFVLTFPLFIFYNSIWVFFSSVCLYFHFYFCISFCAFWFLCFCLSVFIYLFVCNFRQYFLKDRCVLHSACWCACCLRKINFYFKFFCSERTRGYCVLYWN